MAESIGVHIPLAVNATSVTARVLLKKATETLVRQGDSLVYSHLTIGAGLEVTVREFSLTVVTWSGGGYDM